MVDDAILARIIHSPEPFFLNTAVLAPCPENQLQVSVTRTPLHRNSRRKILDGVRLLIAYYGGAGDGG